MRRRTLQRLLLPTLLPPTPTVSAASPSFSSLRCLMMQDCAQAGQIESQPKSDASRLFPPFAFPVALRVTIPWNLSPGHYSQNPCLLIRPQHQKLLLYSFPRCSSAGLFALLH